MNAAASTVRSHTRAACDTRRTSLFCRLYAPFFQNRELAPGYLECILETSGIPAFSTHILINIVINSIICVALPVSSKVFVILL